MLGSSMASPANAIFNPFGSGSGFFDVEKKEAVMVGDPNGKDAKEALEKLKSLTEEAKGAIAALDKDAQADLTYMVTPTSRGEIREATKTLMLLFDEKSALNVGRIQRDMIQTRTFLDDDMPMPLNRKGVVQPRGPERFKRIHSSLEHFVKIAEELQNFVAA